MVNSDEADTLRDGQPSEPEINIQDHSERLALQDMPHPSRGWFCFLPSGQDRDLPASNDLHWLADHEPILQFKLWSASRLCRILDLRYSLLYSHTLSYSDANYMNQEPCIRNQKGLRPWIHWRANLKVAGSIVIVPELSKPFWCPYSRLKIQKGIRAF